MKFCSTEYALDAASDADMRRKKSVFKETTRTRKAVHVTYVTTFGRVCNADANSVQSEVTLDDLFCT